MARGLLRIYTIKVWRHLLRDDRETRNFYCKKPGEIYGVFSMGDIENQLVANNFKLLW